MFMNSEGLWEKIRLDSLVLRPSAPRPFGKLEREKWKEGLVNGLTTSCSSAGMLAELIKIYYQS